MQDFFISLAAAVAAAAALLPAFAAGALGGALAAVGLRVRGGPCSGQQRAGAAPPAPGEPAPARGPHSAGHSMQLGNLLSFSGSERGQMPVEHV